MTLSEAPVLIMAGGTGGHIYPGIAVAVELRTRGVPVVWLGSAVGLETRLVAQAGFPLEVLDIGGIRGKGLRVLFAAPLRILRALLAAITILRRVQPRSVLSLGGFAAGPGGVAAWLLRRPLLVHEQNSVAGVTNRILSQFAQKILCGFNGVFSSTARTVWVGNPVRREIAELPEPQVRFKGRSGPIRLLVLGGSQGAQALNAQLPLALARLPAAERPQVLHQCGARHIDAARAAYEKASLVATVEPFIDDMAAAYAWADLVVCRSGALTLAELTAVGLGAILVPYPHAVDDHQTRNAEAMLAVGAALLLPEHELNTERLVVELTTLLADRPRQLAMAEAARRLAKPDAAVRIAEFCLAAGVR